MYYLYRFTVFVMKKQSEKKSLKVWKLSKDAYLCNPVRNGGVRAGVSGGSREIIEKTEGSTSSKYRETIIFVSLQIREIR